VYWVDTPTGHRCNRHGAEFSRGDVCHRCITDPGDPVVAFTEEDDDADLRARINEARERERLLIRHGRDWLDGTDKEKSLGLKAFDCASKWARISNELQQIIEDRDHDRRLIRHEREMSGIRGGN
jgi:hypothetical protein